MRSFRLCANVLMVVLVAGCLLVVPASADTVPWLTGTFDLWVEGTGPGGADAITLEPPFIYMSIAPPANLPSTTTTECSPQTCLTTTSWDGSAIGGTLSMNVFQSQLLSTTGGGMTGGEISGTRILCDGYNCGSDTYDQWVYHFTFRSVWSNGWWSEGSSDVFTASVYQGTGSLTITTFTPEPGTIALLGTGILGGWQSWKRRSIHSTKRAGAR